MTEQWYALRVKPHKEGAVLGRLQKENVRAYLPLVRVNPVNPRAAKQKPFFPGYLFVLVDMETVGTNLFHWMPGTMGLVTFGGIPAAVPGGLIDEVRKRLQQIEQAGGLVLADLQPGDSIQIVEGPLAGYEAIFDAHLPGKDRVQVLLAFLSSAPQPVTLDANAIKKSKK